jgi:hypothetical protein
MTLFLTPGSCPLTPDSSGRSRNPARQSPACPLTPDSFLIGPFEPFWGPFRPHFPCSQAPGKLLLNRQRDPNKESAAYRSPLIALAYGRAE